MAALALFIGHNYWTAGAKTCETWYVESSYTYLQLMYESLFILVNQQLQIWQQCGML
jgi:hypothetical protein